METGGTGVRIGFCCVIAGAGAALSVAACTDGPGIEQISLTSLSQAFCEKALECGCAPLLAEVGFVPPTSCEAWNLAELFDDQYSPGGEYGDGYDDDDDDSAGGEITRNFDQGCADKLAQALAATSCDRLIPEIACEDYCKLYYGTRFEGEPCDRSIDCAQGLTCAGECRDPCKLQTAGEGESCEFAACDGGLQCTVLGDDEDAPPTCVRPGGSGEPCGDQVCTPGSFCDNTPTGSQCRPRVGVGGACMGHQQCASHYCPAGFCEELPGDGQQCSPQGDCRAGALCVSNEPDQPGTCAAIPQLCGLLLDLPYVVTGYEYTPYYY